MRKMIRKLISISKKLKYRNRAIIGKNIYFGRTTKIEIQDGSEMTDIYISDNVMLLGRLISQFNGKIILESKVNIRAETLICAVNHVKIGYGTIISNNVNISDNNNHPISPLERKEMVESGWSTALWLWRNSDSRPIIIGENVWIGQFARICKGVNIGDNSIVAANAVVTKNVPSNCIVAGNPARVVKYLE